MKLLKTIFGNALIFTMSVASVFLVISILGQALALGFYAFLLAVSAGAIAYLFFRSLN